MLSAAETRPRRKGSQNTRSSMRKPSNTLKSDSKLKKKKGVTERDTENEEEEENMEIEDERFDAHKDEEGTKSRYRTATMYSTDPEPQNALERGTLVRIIKTSDVEQRVPHTIHKIGTIEEVPQHPNTWFKVRINDGEVYKYRPSALKVLSGYEGSEYEHHKGRSALLGSLY